MGMRQKIEAFNDQFAVSWVGKYFEVGARRTTLLTEIRAGFVTFLALAYILAVNSSIIADSGGICSSDDCIGPDKSFDCRFTDPGYKACVDTTRKSLITSTALASLVGSAVMGLGANLPLALAPGMGLNAYFTYNVVGYYGTGSVSYKDALTAVFIEGIIFVILSVTGVRQFLIKLLPRTLSLSMSIGIGLFLSIIGFQAGEGLGVVTADGATLVTLGGCDTNYRVSPYYIPTDTLDSICDASEGPVPNLPAAGTSYQCVGGHKMHSPSMWLGLAGLALIVIFMSRGAKGAIIIGVLFTTFISWIPGHGASYLGNTSDLPGGIGGDGPSRWDYFQKVVAAPSLTNVAGQFDFGGLGTGNVWKALITFLYVDFFDTSGTLMSMATFINSFIPGFMGEDKNFPRSIYAYCSDGISISVGACLGTSPCTAFIESATGIKEGGRTGLTALTVCFCMFVTMFFAPLIASIPVFATGPALIVVGALMMINVTKIPWGDVNHAVPAFLTIAIMPFTYSIAYGVIAGIVSYFICWTVRLGLDWVEQKTGGRLGGHHTVHEDVQAYAHNPPKQGTLPTKSSGTSSDPEDSAHIKVPDPKVADHDPRMDMELGGGPPTHAV